MNVVKAANAEPIPGYRLIEPLGSGGFGEVWKCEAPGGLFKAVKFVRGETDAIHEDSPPGAEQELWALQRVKSLRHPFLLGLDRVEYVEGELVIVMELADCSLYDLLVEYKAAGKPGVPRAELLRYFAEAAEALDMLNQEHGLQHLDVKPRNLFLLGRHVKVADFGLVISLAELSGNAPHAVQMGGGTPVYASPESFLGAITLFSDQYSLAVTYYELLVGAPPFAGKTFRQLALQHLQDEPELTRLPESDRAVVARALAKEPRQRFSSCLAFVRALETGEVGAAAAPPGPAPRRPTPATRSDVPVLDLTSTPTSTRRIAPDAATPPNGVQRPPFPPPASPRATPPGDAPQVRPSGLLAPAAAPAADDALVDLQFRECVVRGPAGETWTARTADGRDRLVRFFFGLNFADPLKENENLARLRGLRHDALEPMEVVGGGERRLAILTDACPDTLACRLLECQGMGLPGVPRVELLARMEAAAEALDALFEAFGLRHLGLTPRQLVVKNGRPRLLDFGVVELIQRAAGQQPGALNPRYAAPELFEGRVHASADAYSLALIYSELLTGAHPIRGAGQRNLASPARRGQPDVGLLPSADRAVLLTALHPDPARRFPTCSAFVAALGPNGACRPAGSRASATTAIPGAPADLTVTPRTRATIRQVINGLVVGAAGELEVREYRNIRYLLFSGRSIDHQFFAKLPAGTEKLRLDGFRQQWHGSAVEADGRRLTLQVASSGGVWRRLLGLQAGLKVRIDTERAGAEMTDVQVRIEPAHRGGEAADRILEERGPELLESLRTFFQALPERRNQARLPFEQTVRVLPVYDDQSEGEAVVSRTRDISMRGMGLTMPGRPPSMRVRIRLPGDPPGEAVAVPACVVRALPRRDGAYEVGVRFLVDEGPFPGGA